MSIKDFFNGGSYKVLASDISKIGPDVESSENLAEKLKEKERFIPLVDFENPKSFAKFGSAAEYYLGSFERIYNSYPYDGSFRERTEFLNKSTYLDLFILDSVYPRTTGYITISSNGWGAKIPPLSTPAAGYPDSIEYIQIIGGPHTASEGMINKELSSTFENSNYYDPGKNRDSNLKFDFNEGVTVELWIRKEQLIPFADSHVETIFHLTNDASGADTSGSFQILLATDQTAPADLPLRTYYVSGSTSDYLIHSGIKNSDLLDNKWHHLALTYKNSGSVVLSTAYLDGALKSTETSDLIDEITGSLIANLGAMRPYTNGVSFTSLSPALEGSAKFSGSIDEFRYWKTARTSEEIGKNWFTQVGGGSNSDDANVDLGVYYKFNEGITGLAPVDSVTLDYSGRISNGTWVGYTEDARSTGSAINENFGKDSEFRDPIIYSFHPQVSSTKSTWAASGSEYDITNNSSIYTSIPSWITDENSDNGTKDLQNLVQIISSYFDTLHLQIDSLATIKNKGYEALDKKPLPFLNKILESSGFIAPEIFANADVIEQILGKDKKQKFELDLTDIKNAIYKNIYNNLTYIFKSKGTEKAFRNLIRCYGVDEELIKINIYGDNVVYDFRDSYRAASVRKKYADFNDPDKFEATVYQQTSSASAATLSYIPGVSSSMADYTAFTAEVEVIFPKKIEESNSAYFNTPFLTSSIYGFHTAITSTSDLTWKSPDFDLQVYSLRPKKDSKDVYFNIQNTDGTINLTTDIFKDVYDNQKWNFAIRLHPTDFPMSDLPSGSGNTGYLLEFSGINSLADYVASEFTLTASLNRASGSAFLGEAKRFYLGAHRTNFTGSTLARTDVKISSLRYWASHLDDDSLAAHARDPSNAGTASPYGNTYLMPTSLAGAEIPQIETLALNWDFSTVTSSDAGPSGIPFISDAGYNVPDVSSGSLTTIDRYRWLGDVVNHQLPGRGDFYLANDTKIMDARYIHSGKQVLPEIVQASNTVSALGETDLIFTRDTKPSRHFFGIEKSMYQTISEEMIKMFATIIDFNNLVGEPVNRYRQEYKNLDKLKSLFFEKVENEPDIEKFINFYRWVDQSLGHMLQKLIPASADFSDGIRNMIESHVLERNKYWSKFPTLEFTPRDPEAGLIGINRHLYDWKVGHHPIDNLQNENCFWWNARTKRDNNVITSGNPAVDSCRQQYLDVSVRALRRSYTTPLRLNVVRDKAIRGGNNIEARKAIPLARSQMNFGTTNGMQISDLTPQEDCADPKLTKTIINGDITTNPPTEYLNSSLQRFFPYTPYSSSEIGIQFNNLHKDAYGPDMETPMQGPFTNANVGGLQFRHIPINLGSDSQDSRPEGWNFDILPPFSITHPEPHNPRAMYYRDETAKRPLNIKNLKGAGGNYEHDYQIVMTSGRSINNRAFVKYGGFPLNDPVSDSSSSYWIPDMATLNGAEIQRNGPDGEEWGPNEFVIVERFSSPGGPDTMGDANGGPGLDRYAAEMSPNNDLNYRNHFVRNVLQMLQTSHVNRFGYFSNSAKIPGAQASTVNPLNYEGTGSIYQVNRNTGYAYRLSASTVIKDQQYDNWYVQHQIPQSDFQYAWITSSYISSPFCGFLPPSGAPYSSSIGLTPAITFGPLSSSYPWQIWPTWEQIRTGQTANARHLRENNLISYRNSPGPSFKNKVQKTIIPRFGPQKTFSEPCVVSKYRPIAQILNSETNTAVGVIKLEVNSSYANDLSFFSHEEINADLDLQPQKSLAYDSIKDKYLQTPLINKVTGEKEYNFQLFDSIIYKEIVFPAAPNTYKKRNREREGYQNDFWRNSRSKRTALGKTKFGG